MSWELRRIYEPSLTPKGAWIDPHIYTRAFPQEHVIEGHSVKCIFARPKHVTYSHLPGAGMTQNEGVLIVESAELSGLRRGGSLRIDGEVYRIAAVSFPVPGLTRAELSGCSE